MRRLEILCVLVLLASCARWAREPRFGSLRQDDRPFAFRHNIELVEVSNGLRVALIHDVRTNLATVDLRYAVGAAEDPPGRAGMAHLVEHLVFELRGEPGGPTVGEELGELALFMNAWTSWDYTHYSTHVPVEHLERALALEAWRMLGRCDQLDEAVFLREREIVRNEGRERRSAATDAMRSLLGDIYGDDHPYARPITSDEIATVTRAEACAFLEKHYTPDRAYLVVTGPYDPGSIQGLVGRSFGPIARKSSGPRAAVARPTLDGKTTRRTAPISKPTALVYFSHPAWGADGAVKFLLGRQALAAALARADDQNGWITDTAVYVEGGWRAPVLVAAIEVSDVNRLQDAATEVFVQAGQLLEGATPRALSPALGELTMAYVASWDDLPDRGPWIADFMQFTDHDWFMLKDMRQIMDTNWRTAIGELRASLRADRSRIVLLTPGDAKAGAKATSLPSGSHDLTPWRAHVDPADADRPIELERSPARARVEEYSLANGLTVQLAPDADSPVIDARLVFPVGSAHEPRDRPYLATAAARLLSYDLEGYYDARMLNKLDWALSRGTEYDAAVGETATMFAVRGMAHWADWHVWMLSWLLDQGRYNATTIEALHDAARAQGGDEEEMDPVARAFLSRLFGAGHPYAVPDPKRGAAFLRIGADDLERWRERYFRARGATLVVSGGFDVAAMKRVIDELFGPWSGAEPAVLPFVPPARPAKGPTWLAADDEDASQTRLVIGFATRSDPGRDAAARAVVAEMLQDALRDVREGMGASYGMQARYRSGASGGMLRVSGDVDESKAGTVLVHVLDTLTKLREGGDDQRAAFVRARKKVLAQMMGRMGGASAMAGELAWNAAQGHSLRHGTIVATQVSALKLDDVVRVAAADLADARRVVLVSGKRASVDAAYAAIAVTPERPAPEPRARDEKATAEPGRPEPAPEPDRPPSRPRPHRPEDGPKLGVGAPEGLVASTRSGLFLGDRPITLDEFLRIAGEEEALARMSRRKWIRRGMFGVGIVGAATSVLIMATLPACEGNFRERNECIDSNSGKKNTATFTLAIGGIVAAVGSQIGRGAPSTEELRRIAARYNRVVVAPEVTDQGAGIVVSGRF